MHHDKDSLESHSGDDHHSVPKNWKWPPMPTEKEMDDLYIGYKFRDRCAGILLPWVKCLHSNNLFTFMCKKEHLRYKRCLHYE